jgi:hypothetical protein
MKHITLFVLVLTLFSSCKKFLDAKPNKALAIPASLQDMQAILDNEFNLNSQYPAMLEVAADDYYVTAHDFEAFYAEEDKENYCWLTDAQHYNSWAGPYKSVSYANTVLDNLDNIKIIGTNKLQWNNCKGQALFFRAFALFNLAQLYCPAFNSNGPNDAPGIPIKLSAAVDEPTVRATVRESYDRILADLKEAARLLPVTVPAKTRPSKPAAYAALARVFLAMENYTMAGKYADSCLQLYNKLIDFNTINASASIPFSRFNDEVILHSYSPGSGLLNIARCKVDSNLYSAYQENDLRKEVFFKNNNDGTHSFKGSYNATTSNYFFNGLATDEVYLVKAECLARNNNTAEAMNTLNALLANRWKAGTFIPLTATDSIEALQQILEERRKELLMRGLRWQDLRRLNKDSRFAKTLTRILDTGTYSLPANDPRYVLLIPSEVIVASGIQQNPR